MKFWFDWLSQEMGAPCKCVYVSTDLYYNWRTYRWRIRFRSVVQFFENAYECECACMRAYVYSYTGNVCVCFAVCSFVLALSFQLCCSLL